MAKLICALAVLAGMGVAAASVLSTDQGVPDGRYALSRVVNDLTS